MGRKLEGFIRGVSLFLVLTFIISWHVLYMSSLHGNELVCVSLSCIRAEILSLLRERPLSCFRSLRMGFEPVGEPKA